MSGSILGKNFTVSTWGESHGPALGAIIDGCPAGIKLDLAKIQQDLDRRKPGQSRFTTTRKEQDKVEILSGVFEGKTTGTPISLIIYNQDQRSADYTEIAASYRPGHADLVYQTKYGIRDYRGGGRSSGRETAARVGAGAIARQLLAEFNIDILAYTYSIGNIVIDPHRFDREVILTNPLAMPDSIAAKASAEYLKKIQANGDSAGGVIECIVQNVPVGLGEPVFSKLDAELAKALFSIGAVKAVEIGSGTTCSQMSGWEHNDFYRYQEDGEIIKESNHAGGILGGISDGSPIKIRIHFKPTPSIHRTQSTINAEGDNIDIAITGRHDPIIVPRAVIVVEAMVALILTDFLLQAALSKVSNLKKIFS